MERSPVLVGTPFICFPIDFWFGSCIWYDVCSTLIDLFINVIYCLNCYYFYFIFCLIFCFFIFNTYFLPTNSFLPFRFCTSSLFYQFWNIIIAVFFFIIYFTIINLIICIFFTVLL